jgi:hypothetical protein
MGTFDSVYKNKIRQLEEENRQLRKILREAEAGQVYPPTPIIPTPEVSPPDSPARGYERFDPDNHYWRPPMDPAQIKPRYGPWRIPTSLRPFAPGFEGLSPYNPSPYRPFE